MVLVFCILGIHAYLGFRNSCFGFISVVATPCICPHTLKIIVQFALDIISTGVLYYSLFNKYDKLLILPKS